MEAFIKDLFLSYAHYATFPSGMLPKNRKVPSPLGQLLIASYRIQKGVPVKVRFHMRAVMAEPLVTLPPSSSVSFSAYHKKKETRANQHYATAEEDTIGIH